jgi:hypothetical protein
MQLVAVHSLHISFILLAGRSTANGPTATTVAATILGVDGNAIDTDLNGNAYIKAKDNPVGLSSTRAAFAPTDNIENPKKAEVARAILKVYLLAFFLLSPYITYLTGIQLVLRHLFVRRK